jgi:hypothetical protein
MSSTLVFGFMISRGALQFDSKSKQKRDGARSLCVCAHRVTLVIYLVGPGALSITLKTCAHDAPLFIFSVA